MNESSLAVNAFIQQPQCRPQGREFRIVINPTNTLRLVNDQLLENLVLTRPIWSMNRQEARTLAYRLGVSFDDGERRLVHQRIAADVHHVAALRAHVREHTGVAVRFGAMVRHIRLLHAVGEHNAESVVLVPHLVDEPAGGAHTRLPSGRELRRKRHDARQRRLRRVDARAVRGAR